MTTFGVVFLSVLAVFGILFWALRRTRPDEPAAETYVCDVCGETQCTCRREDSDGS